MPDDTVRRFKAKKFNEHVRLGATTVNAIAIFVLVAGFLQPLVQKARPIINAAALVWIVWGIGLHIGAQAILRMLKDEA